MLCVLSLKYCIIILCTAQLINTCHGKIILKLFLRKRVEYNNLISLFV